MNVEVLGAAVAVIGVLLWIRRDMRHDIAELRRDLSVQIAAVDNKLSATVRDVNTRIDNILLRRSSRSRWGRHPFHINGPSSP